MAEGIRRPRTGDDFLDRTARQIAELATELHDTLEVVAELRRAECHDAVVLALDCRRVKLLRLSYGIFDLLAEGTGRLAEDRLADHAPVELCELLVFAVDGWEPAELSAVE